MSAAARALAAQHEQRRRRMVLDVAYANKSHDQPTKLCETQPGKLHAQPETQAVNEGATSQEKAVPSHSPAGPSFTSSFEHRALAIMQQRHPTRMMFTSLPGGPNGQGERAAARGLRRRWGCKPLPWALRQPSRPTPPVTKADDLNTRCVKQSSTSAATTSSDVWQAPAPPHCGPAGGSAAPDQHRPKRGMEVRLEGLRPNSDAQPRELHGGGRSICEQGNCYLWGALPRNCNSATEESRGAFWQQSAVETSPPSTAKYTPPLIWRESAAEYAAAPLAADESCTTSYVAPASSYVGGRSTAAAGQTWWNFLSDSSAHQHDTHFHKLRDVLNALIHLQAADWPPAGWVSNYETTMDVALTIAQKLFHERRVRCGNVISSAAAEMERQQRGLQVVARLRAEVKADVVRLRRNLQNQGFTGGLVQATQVVQASDLRSLWWHVQALQPHLQQQIRELLNARNRAPQDLPITEEQDAMLWLRLKDEAEKLDVSAAHPAAQEGERLDPFITQYGVWEVFRSAVLGTVWLSGSELGEREVLDPQACALLGVLFPLLYSVLPWGKSPCRTLLSPSSLYVLLRHGPTSQHTAEDMQSSCNPRFSLAHIQFLIRSMESSPGTLLLLSKLASLIPAVKDPQRLAIAQLVEDLEVLDTLDWMRWQVQAVMQDVDREDDVTELLGDSGTFSSPGHFHDVEAVVSALHTCPPKEWCDAAVLHLMAEKDQQQLLEEQGRTEAFPVALVPVHVFDVLWAKVETEGPATDEWKRCVGAMAQRGLLDVDYGNEIAARQFLEAYRSTSVATHSGWPDLNDSMAIAQLSSGDCRIPPTVPSPVSAGHYFGPRATPLQNVQWLSAICGLRSPGPDAEERPPEHLGAAAPLPPIRPGLCSLSPCCDCLVEGAQYTMLALLLLLGLSDVSELPPMQRFMFRPRLDRELHAVASEGKEAEGSESRRSGGAGRTALAAPVKVSPSAAAASAPPSSVRLTPVHLGLVPKRDSIYRNAYRWQSCMMYSLTDDRRVTATSRLDKGLKELRTALLKKRLGMVGVAAQGLGGVQRALVMAAQIADEMGAQGMELRVCVVAVTLSDKNPHNNKQMNEDLHNLLNRTAKLLATNDGLLARAAESGASGAQQARESRRESGDQVTKHLRLLMEALAPGKNVLGWASDDLVLELRLCQMDPQRSDMPVMPLLETQGKKRLEHKLRFGNEQ